ncbi:MAG: 2-5 ligase superfamily protein [Paenibacillus sp.]|nr:2-5 ligase superfamily protein [Paenibacillus sp.]
MYAFELFLDDETDKYVRDCWRAAADHKISSFMNQIEGVRPHITLAFCQKADIESAIEALADFAQQKEVELDFDILGSFPTSGTLFLSPTMTERFKQFHQQFHDKMKACTSEHSDHYTINHWNPHCTLATRMNRAELAQAYELIVGEFKPLRSRVTEVGLVELIYEGQVCIKNIHHSTCTLAATG